MPASMQEDLRAIFTGQGGGLTISAALGLAWYVWTQFQSYRATTRAALVLCMATFVIGPEVGTRFFPVYSKITIVSVKAYGEGQSRAVFKFNKLRQCDPQGSAWFAVKWARPFEQLPMSIQGGGSSLRPLGEQFTSPYIIDARPDVVRGAVFAEIYSRCWPLWTTRSVIYPYPVRPLRTFAPRSITRCLAYGGEYVTTDGAEMNVCSDWLFARPT